MGVGAACHYCPLLHSKPLPGVPKWTLLLRACLPSCLPAEPEDAYPKYLPAAMPACLKHLPRMPACLYRMLTCLYQLPACLAEPEGGQGERAGSVGGQLLLHVPGMLCCAEWLRCTLHGVLYILGACSVCCGLLLRLVPGGRLLCMLCCVGGEHVLDVFGCTLVHQAGRGS